MLTATFDGVVEKSAEDTGNDLGVCGELAELPGLALVSWRVNPGLLRFEALLTENLLILTQLIESLEDVTFFIAIRVADPIHSTENSRYLRHRLA